MFITARIEKQTIHWYRSLPNIERLAVNAFLRGDPRLMVWLWPNSDDLQRYDFDYLQLWLLEQN